jgi:hypothetical protein
MQTKEYKIHGRCKIPQDFIVVPVPRHSTFENDSPEIKTIPKFRLSSGYSLVKILLALGQALYATATLIEATKGKQIERFGYAAYGLTVAPYAFMSLINLLGHLICPEYPKKYLVDSEGFRHLCTDLGKSEKYPLCDSDAGIVVEGIVGKLDNKSDLDGQRTEFRYSLDGLELIGAYLALILGTAVSVGIIGGLTKFHPGSSTWSQRTWTMTWLSFGIFLGWLDTGVFDEKAGELTADNDNRMLFMLAYSSPAIGGFVVVSQMLSAYGVCTTIT